MESIFNSPARPQNLGVPSVDDLRRAGKLKMLSIMRRHTQPPARFSARSGCVSALGQSLAGDSPSDPGAGIGVDHIDAGHPPSRVLRCKETVAPKQPWPMPNAAITRALGREPKLMCNAPSSDQKLPVETPS